MSRQEKWLFVFLVLVATGSWIAVAASHFQKTWQEPLGPSLSLPSQTNGPTLDKINLLDSSKPVFDGTGVPVSTLLPKIIGQPADNPNPPLCAGPESITLLVIGSDTRADNYLYGLADVIRYIRVDFTAPDVAILEFPRDLWVEIPEIANHYGITHGKLNQAYLYGNPGMGYYPGPGQGPGLLAQTLSLNFGAQPDHYLAINMQSFAKLIDTLGGIDVFLPIEVDGRKSDQQKCNDLYFAPGYHHLNGQETLMLARIRQYSVFDRAKQQNHIFCGLQKAVLSPKILPRLPKIIQEFAGSVQTDFSPQDISQLACLIPFLKPSDITFATFPLSLLTVSREFDIGVQKDVFVYKADFRTLQTYVKAFDMGVWPHYVPSNTPSANDETLPKEIDLQCP